MNKVSRAIDWVKWLRTTYPEQHNNYMEGNWSNTQAYDFVLDELRNITGMHIIGDSRNFYIGSINAYDASNRIYQPEIRNRYTTINGLLRAVERLKLNRESNMRKTSEEYQERWCVNPDRNISDYSSTDELVAYLQYSDEDVFVIVYRNGEVSNFYYDGVKGVSDEDKALAAGFENLWDPKYEENCDTWVDVVVSEDGKVIRKASLKQSARELNKEQKEILDRFFEEYGDDLGYSFKPDKDLPIEYWDELEEINDFETLYQDIKRYIIDKMGSKCKEGSKSITNGTFSVSKESHIELDNEDCILEVGDSIEIINEEGGITTDSAKEVLDQYGGSVPVDELVVLPYVQPFGDMKWSDLYNDRDIEDVLAAEWWENQDGVLMASLKEIRGLSEDEPIDYGVNFDTDELFYVEDVLHRFSEEDGFYHA